MEKNREIKLQNIKKILKEYTSDYEISLNDKNIFDFQVYMEFLLEWNEKINLTAIKDPENIVIKHFLDSLLLQKAVKIETKAKMIDIGTGAGFPGVPTKIVRPDIDLTLLDSLNKRLIFLEQLGKKLQIDFTLIHSRAEEGGRQKNLREQFDIVTARAVAPLNLLCEYCLPFVKVGGIFAAMKGPEIEEELFDAKNAIGILCGEILSCKKFCLPDNSGRTIVLIQKTKTISDKYPRHGSKISKNPL